MVTDGLDYEIQCRWLRRKLEVALIDFYMASLENIDQKEMVRVARGKAAETQCAYDGCEWKPISDKKSDRGFLISFLEQCTLCGTIHEVEVPGHD